MHPVVYLPLLLPVVAAASARRVADRLDPRLATWVLTVSSVLLAAASGLVLAALAATALGQIRIVARAGDWSIRILRRHDPTGPYPAAVAGLLLVIALAALLTVVVRRAVALLDTARTARRLPGGSLTVLADPAPHAYTLPGRPGRIVVSTGLLRALDPAERKVLLAHEQAHLRYLHHAFVTVAQLAAATNPLLRPTAKAVAYAVERWADEHAARVVGDRELAARALGKAALLAGRQQGPVPMRIAALLSAPPRRPVVWVAVTAVVLAVATLAAAQTARDVHAAFELAERPAVHNPLS
ncbi:MAG TPA: M56 family metallopeptidase [Pseudonocardiaceae bacterium]